MKKVSIASFIPLPDGSDQYPLEYIENTSVIKLRESEERVIIGVSNRHNEALLESLSNFHDKEVIFYHIEKSELAAYLGKKFSIRNVEVLSGKGPENEHLLLDKLANDAPIINLVNSLLIEGITKGASDIHIESFENDVIVRYRIDGELYTHSKISISNFPGISSRIKIMANLNIMEKRLPQDGRISVHIEEETIDLRVSIVPIAKGESIVLRIFQKNSIPLSLSDLGFDDVTLTELRSLYRVPHGLILATGPTGCGKTTSLSAIIRELNSESRKIITIEDPVEYVIDGVDQIQTNERIGLSFDSILRRILRQDPDIIMVGEIRDIQTAELSLKAALTGHLVLSSLHTNDAVSVINRLRDMGIEPFLLAAVLRGAIAQRLVRRLCPKCKEVTTPSPADTEILKINAFKLEKVYKSRGCKLCNNTGFNGRIALMEIFTSDEEIEEMIVRMDRSSQIKEYLTKRGMKSLLKDGLAKVAAGLTTMDEIQKVIV